jgi:hypothetical protein
MVQTAIVKPLGTVLLRGGLISPAQVEVALVDQRHNPTLRIGDVLELRGWLHRSTLEFFSEEWPQLVAGEADHPLGVYLQKAGLLTQKQLDTLLKEQLQTGMRIGALAVLHGWLKQETLDLFLRGIAPEHHTDSVFKPLRQSQEHENSGPQENIDLYPSRAASATAQNDNDEEIPWVD